MSPRKSNSLTRRYAKLDKLHAEIMKPAKGKKERHDTHKQQVSSYMYILTYKHTNVLTYIHTYIHTYINT